MSSKLAHAYACYYYNKGLDRARVRDIYGAIRMLRRSLEMDKNYVNSRNLLGLCLYEIGEVGEAISEWNISKSIDKVNPRADYFLNALKANPGKVAYYRTTIRKCNNGLSLMKQDADDLALIQLKRAVSRNPNYVKAWQLLALLYMRNRDYSKARKCLKRSLKTDIANPDSLRYLKAIKGVRERNTELSVTIASPSAEDMDVKEILDGKAKQSIVPHYNYEEGRPDYRVFISLLAGILIGIMVVYYLIVPGVKQSLKQDTADKEKQHGSELANYLTELDSLEKENTALQSKIEMIELEGDGLKEQLKALSEEKYYDNILNAYVFYLSFEDKDNPGEFALYELKQKLLLVSDKEKESESAKFLFDDIVKKYPDILTMELSGAALLEEGKAKYEEGDYAKASEYFTLAYEASPDNEEVLYMLGRSTQLTGDKTKALSYYREYCDKYPEGGYLTTVKQWMAAIGG
ncbi:MAG: tetratricopeptide repeat protein [Lachnospiraceae bacterium]|nr:tetratricopeptide repeat protein [Lachnospiraceae bacterium]